MGYITVKAGYCIVCGKHEINKWPMHGPVACSLKCLGNHLVAEYWAGGDGFYCHECGGQTDGGCECSEEEDTNV